MADFQDQRAYLKQPAIFQNSKRALAALGKKRSGAKIEATVKGAAVTEVVSKSRDLKIPRYVRNVGLGFKTPASAISGAYIDKKCPFTGSVSARKPADSEYFYSPLAISVAPHYPMQVSIRGRILRGVVVSTKMQRSVILRRDYLHYIKKYNRYEKRHKNFAAHVSPCFKLSVGDGVIAGQCRCARVLF